MIKILFYFFKLLFIGHLLQLTIKNLFNKLFSDLLIIMHQVHSKINYSNQVNYNNYN